MNGPENERGSATLELTVLALGLFALLGLLVVAGRVQVTAHAVEEAARDAARQASIARSAQSAHSTATTAALTTIQEQGLQCTGVHVSVDTSGFHRPAGEPAQVSATVSCRVRLSDIAVPGLAGSHPVQATFHSPMDTYRQRLP